MIRITKEELVSHEEGLRIPQHIDELRCAVCSTPIGWCSEGSFIDFYEDDSKEFDLCTDCKEQDMK
jgi:hypothetical protein